MDKFYIKKQGGFSMGQKDFVFSFFPYRSIHRHGEIRSYQKQGVTYPFFFLLSEKGVLQFFFRALFEKKEEEVRNYFSKDVRFFDMEAMYHLFQERDLVVLKFGLEKKIRKKNSRTISVLLGKSGNVVHFQLVREPDQFSIWKIIQIKKE